MSKFLKIQSFIDLLRGDFAAAASFGTSIPWTRPSAWAIGPNHNHASGPAGEAMSP
ncbi:MAG TPA: hypothetical protein PLZ57_07810 [Pseudobdellovibrionaceae bacterium]|nr:hypothetical protein [Pseudobdellovibrionaceae bacterium]